MVLGTALLSALPLGAQEIWVSIVEPQDGSPVIGELDVVVDVVSRADISEIEFQLDGRPIGTLSMEPFRMHVDLGEETAAQRNFLLAAGCKVAQGFYFGQAMPAKAAAELLSRHRQLAAV